MTEAPRAAAIGRAALRALDVRRELSAGVLVGGAEVGERALVGLTVKIIGYTSVLKKRYEGARSFFFLTRCLLRGLSCESIHWHDARRRESRSEIRASDAALGVVAARVAL